MSRKMIFFTYLRFELELFQLNERYEGKNDQKIQKNIELCFWSILDNAGNFVNLLIFISNTKRNYLS